MCLASLPLDNGIPDIVERLDLPNSITFDYIPLTYVHFELGVVIPGLSKLYTYVVPVNYVLQNSKPVAEERFSILVHYFQVSRLGLYRAKWTRMAKIIRDGQVINDA